MSYDLVSIGALVHSRLTANPAIRLSEIAAELKVDRHTIGRALQLRFGRSFRELRRDALTSGFFAPSQGGPFRTAEGHLGIPRISTSDFFR